MIYEAHVVWTNDIFNSHPKSNSSLLILKAKKTTIRCLNGLQINNIIIVDIKMIPKRKADRFIIGLYYIP